jgi:glycosyltransferase involved in cell wall biosynthesis
LSFYGPIYASNFQHIHPYKLVWGIMASFGGLAASRFKDYFPDTPYLLTLQEGDDLAGIEKKVKLTGPFARMFTQIFSRADEIQAISHYLMSWAFKMGAKGEVRLVPNGVDLDLFRPQPKIALPGKIIITTSRLVTKNGVDTLIKAMSHLPSDYRLMILGDGPLRERLKQLAYNLGIEDQVEFTGVLPHDQMITYLNQADVFCRPARSEGLGNSYLEAMALGLPTIGTPVGGIPDFLINKETGWLCEVDNDVQIAATIKKILDASNKDDVKRVIAKAKQLVCDRYSIEIVAASMAKIFANIKTRPQ